MITNSGINLLSKYVAGQLPTFASHIAIGCGPKALAPGDSFGDYTTKTSLDLEMLRVPITSRAVRIIDGESYVVFTGDLPAANRYAITEVGIYPAEKSNISGSVDSIMLNSFSLAEVWSTHDGTTLTDIDLETVVEATAGSIGPASSATVFALNSDNTMFTGQRLTRQEQPRYLNEAIAIRGDYSTVSGGNLVYTGKHIHKTAIDLSDLDQANQYLDKLELGFSVVSTSIVNDSNPSALKIAIDFSSDDPNAAAPTAYARWIMTPTVTTGSRYMVESTALSSLTKTTGFKWSDVTNIRIYVNADSSTDFYVILDALRFENFSAIDSQYSLAGYTVLKNTSSQPIIKNENGSSLIEYRFKLDVV